MNAPQPPLDWTQANQQLLATEFARLKALLAGEPVEETSQRIEACRAALASPAGIDQLSEIFGLSSFERDIVLMCAGVEMDSALAGLCASERRCAWASFSTALATFPAAHWDALTPIRPLRRWRLIETDDRDGIVNARLRIDERMLHYLAGANYLDVRLQPLVRPQALPLAMTETHRRICDTVLATPRDDPEANLVILHGDDEDGQADVAAQAAAGMGLQLFAVRGEELPQSPSELDAFAVLWQREAVLSGLALLIESGSAEVSKSVARLAERLGSLCFITCRDPMTLVRPRLLLRVDKPSSLEQRQLWEQALASTAGRLNGSLTGIAAQFRLSARTIGTKGKELRTALLTSGDPDLVLWSTCRSLGRTKLDDLAQRIVAATGWNDLVLPEPEKSLLRQIVAHVRQRHKVYEEWGFAAKCSRGLGISALFTGESGTGKTMAAEVLANELHLDLYRIDLSSVISKYIGETEKNLKRVFDAAEESGAMLLFDEADALFGKRSEVKDSHDRYANIEVSYLLQRMETYSGLAILTTNHKTALDSAFQRRLRFIVQFPFPDQTQREGIWRAIFPRCTPLNGIDYAKLARLNVTGGHIRNIALNAAFLAAEAGQEVSMAQLLAATHSEASKRERAVSDGETRGWV
jgi:AAA+ superfamily predicted ATPase